MSDEKEKLAIKKRGSVFDVYNHFFDDFEKRFTDIFRLRDFFKPSWDIECCALEPLMDYEITKDEVIATFDLPNVEKENIEVHCSEKSIEIEAEMTKKVAFKKWGTKYHQREFSSLRKSIHLPISIIPEKANAEFKQGMLKITAPRKRTRHKIDLK